MADKPCTPGFLDCSAGYLGGTVFSPLFGTGRVPAILCWAEQDIRLNGKGTNHFITDQGEKHQIAVQFLWKELNNSASSVSPSKSLPSSLHMSFSWKFLHPSTLGSECMCPNSLQSNEGLLGPSAVPDLICRSCLCQVITLSSLRTSSLLFVIKCKI